MQANHQRHEIVSAALGLRDEAAEIGRRMDDVGVGQQQVVRMSPVGDRDAQPDRPELAGPPGWKRLRRHDGQAIVGTCCRSGGTRRGSGAVAAAVVDHDDVQFAAIILGEQRCDRSANHIGLVARRDYGNDGAR